MDAHLKEFVNPDQPFGPLAAPTIHNFTAFSSLFDTQNAISKELNKRAGWIIGRRGAGKTAFLNSFSLDPKYAVIVALEPGDAFPSMLRAIEQKLPGNVLVEESARLWHNLLWGAVFQEMLARFPEHSASTLLPISQYLDGLGITARMNLYGVMRAILNAIASLNHQAKAVIDVIEDMASRGVTFREAQAAAETFLRERQLAAIILMDSLEAFPLAEPAMANAMTGLLSCVGQFNQPGMPCEIRCCLPAELYPRLLDLAANPLKDLSSRTVLHWRAHELFHLAAMRYRAFVRLYDPDAYHRHFASLDIAERNGLRAFWSHVLPATITNRLGGKEDTVAYLLRHTQLLPRHLLLYLNEISKKALAVNGKAYRFCEDAVIDGIRGSEHMLCKEIFSGFRQVYPKAEAACEAMLPNLAMTFKFGDLHRAFNRNRRWLDDFEDPYEIVAVLLRIGAIGVVTGEDERYTNATFEYTLPENVKYRSDDTFCVHPIFVEHFRVVDPIRGGGVRPVYPSLGGGGVLDRSPPKKTAPWWGQGAAGVKGPPRRVSRRA